MPILDPMPIEKDQQLLRRAHAALAYLAQIYVHTQIVQETVPMLLPSPISIPLVTVSKYLDIAPILTYSDISIYNWAPINPDQPVSMTNLRGVLNFSGNKDEEHFYLTSTCIESRGLEAVELMRASLQEASVADYLTKTRLTDHLSQLTGVMDELTAILVRVRESCDPSTFYNRIRPWLRGGNSIQAG